MIAVRIEGNRVCDGCEKNAEFYVNPKELYLCRSCALELYKSLGVFFVPRAIPNVVLRAERQAVLRVGEVEKQAQITRSDEVANINSSETSNAVEIISSSVAGSVEDGVNAGKAVSSGDKHSKHLTNKRKINGASRKNKKRRQI